MSTQTPTTIEISNNIIAQLETQLGQSLRFLPKSFHRVMAKALAGVFILLYKYIGFGILQTFVRTCSSKDTIINGQVVNPLVEWGRQIGVGDPVSATRAELLIDVTVLNQVGTLNAGSQLVGTINGVTYLTLNSVLLDAPVVQVLVRAQADQSGGNGSGAIGNLDAGDQLTFANALPDVDRTATVDSQVVTGANAEDLEVYRQRVLDRFQKRPQGGALSDYELWGERVAGIINIFPYRSDCPGQVDAYVEATQESSGSPDGIPTTAQLEAVLDAFTFDENDRATRKPVGALANTFPITRLAYDVRVIGLTVDNQPDIQAQIEAGTAEYFLQRGPFIIGLSVPPNREQVSRASVTGVVDAIVSANGGTFANLVLTRNALNIITETLGIGEKAKQNSITFI